MNIFSYPYRLRVFDNVRRSGREESSLGPRKVGNAEHVVDIKEKQNGMGNVHSLETSSKSWRHGRASNPILGVKGRSRNGIGDKAVAETTGKMGKPIEWKEEGIIGVTPVGHSNAHKGDVETSESHESDNVAGRIADHVGGSVGPKPVVHDKESKVLDHHHGGMEADGRLVGGKREDGHLGFCC